MLIAASSEARRLGELSAIKVVRYIPFTVCLKQADVDESQLFVVSAHHERGGVRWELLAGIDLLERLPSIQALQTLEHIGVHLSVVARLHARIREARQVVRLHALSKEINNLSQVREPGPRGVRGHNDRGKHQKSCRRCQQKDRFYALHAHSTENLAECSDAAQRPALTRAGPMTSDT